MTEFFATIAIFLSGLFGGGEPAQPTLGAFSDVFLSIQVGTSPTNGDFLVTDGTDSTWTDCTTLLGAGLCDGSDATGAGGGGSGSVSTSTNEVANQVAVFTSNSATPATIGGDTDFTFLTDRLTVTNASTSRFSALNEARFGATATSTFNSAGVLTLVTPLAVASGGTGTTNRTLDDAGGDNTVDWGSLVLEDGSGNTTVNWGTGLLREADGTTILNWETQQLSTGAGALAIDFSGVPNLIFQASSTIFSAHRGFFGATATTTIDAEGDIALPAAGTFTIDSETYDSLHDDATLANNSGDLQVVDVTCTNCIGATEINDLDVASGGTGAATLTGILEGNGTSAITANDSSTAGQVLRVTGASAFGFGALDLDDTDAVTGTTAVSNGGTNLSTFGGVNTVLFTTAADTLSSKTTFAFNTNTTSLGIGTSTPRWSIQAASSTGPQLALSDGSLTSPHWTMRNAGGNLYFATSSPGTFATATPAAVEFRNSGGAALGIGTSTPWRTLSVVGTVSFDGLSAGTGGDAVCIDADDDIEDAGATTCALSTILAKDNVMDFGEGEAVSILEKLRAVSFDWKPEYQPNGDGKASISLIAEEAAAVDPRLADNGSDGKPRGLVTNAFIGLFTSLFQNHESRIEALERENADLRARLDAAGI